MLLNTNWTDSGLEEPNSSTRGYKERLSSPIVLVEVHNSSSPRGYVNESFAHGLAHERQSLVGEGGGIAFISSEHLSFFSCCFATFPVYQKHIAIQSKMPKIDLLMRCDGTRLESTDLCVVYATCCHVSAASLVIEVSLWRQVLLPCCCAVVNARAYTQNCLHPQPVARNQG